MSETNDDDHSIFQEYMRDVTPLKSNPNAKTHRRSRTDTPSNGAPRAAPKQALSDFIAEAVDTEAVLSYSVSGLTASQFKPLRQGRLSIEARLDLHGLTTEQARSQLIAFMHQQEEAFHRHVLIIHGKGGHKGQPPVIKNLINRWLPQFSSVLAFHSALPRDGGTGAMYVLLKRAGRADYTSS